MTLEVIKVSVSKALDTLGNDDYVMVAKVRLHIYCLLGRYHLHFKLSIMHGTLGATLYLLVPHEYDLDALCFCFEDILQSKWIIILLNFLEAIIGTFVWYWKEIKDKV